MLLLGLKAASESASAGHPKSQFRSSVLLFQVSTLFSEANATPQGSGIRL